MSHTEWMAEETGGGGRMGREKILTTLELLGVAVQLEPELRQLDWSRD